MQAFVIKNPSLPVISLNHSSSKNLRRSQQQTNRSCPSMFWARTDQEKRCRFLCAQQSACMSRLSSLPSACYPAIRWSWRKSFKRLWCPLPLWGFSRRFLPGDARDQRLCISVALKLRCITDAMLSRITDELVDLWAAYSKKTGVIVNHPRPCTWYTNEGCLLASSGQMT